MWRLRWRRNQNTAKPAVRVGHRSKTKIRYEHTSRLHKMTFFQHLIVSTVQSNEGKTTGYVASLLPRTTTLSVSVRLLYNISHQATSAKFWRTYFFRITSHFLCYLLIRWRELIGPSAEINGNWCCERRSSRIILASVHLMQMIHPWKWTHKPYSSQRRWPQGPQQPALYYSQLWPAGWTFQSTGGSQRSDTLDAPWGRADGREDVLSRSAESKAAGVSWLKSVGSNPPWMMWSTP